MAEAYATRHGLDLSEESFHDLAVSAYRGKNAETGRLAEFLEAVRAGSVPAGSFLLVESMDRISRAKPRRAMEILGGICAESITVVTLDDEHAYTEKSLDDDPWAFLVAFIKATRANEESATKARRLQASWSNKRKRLEQGHILTTICPAWLQLDRAANKFKPISSRAKVVRQIYERAARGEGQHAIAKALNTAKVPTLGRAKFWQRSYIAKILSNPAVIGTLTPHTIEHTPTGRKRYAQEAVPNYYPAVLPRALYDTVQSLRVDLGAPQRGRHANKKLNNVFAGLARCPLCQGGVTLQNKGGDYRYLICTNAKTGGGCAGGRARYRQVEEAFLEGATSAAADCPSDNEAAQILLQEANDLDMGLGLIIDKIEDLVETAALGKRGPSRSINDRVVAMEGQVEEMRQKRDTLLAKAEAMTGAVLQKRIERLQEAIAAKTLDRRAVNVALRTLVSAVDIDFAAGAMLLHWKHGERPGEIVYDGAAMFDEAA